MRSFSASCEQLLRPKVPLLSSPTTLLGCLVRSPVEAEVKHYVEHNKQVEQRVLSLLPLRMLRFMIFDLQACQGCRELSSDDLGPLLEAMSLPMHCWQSWTRPPGKCLVYSSSSGFEE